MEGRCPRNTGLQLQSHIQGTRTPDWPAQPQPSHEPPVTSPLQAPVTLEPDSSVERKLNYLGGRIGREHQEPLNYKNRTHKRHANRVMNTLQAHGTTTHELTQNTAGQSQPQDSHGPPTLNKRHYTAKTLASAYKESHWPDYLLAITLYIHKLYHKCYITHQTLADGQNTNTTCKRTTLLTR